MSAQSTSQEKKKAYVRLLQNPYASLSLEDAPSEHSPAQPSFEQKRAYFRLLQNPHAYDAVFGDPDSHQDVLKPAAQVQQRWVSGAATDENAAGNLDLEKELDGLLRLYRPYVARNEWSHVVEYRANFLERATRSGVGVSRVIDRLGKLRFSLLPNEKVEYNRAPADRIIGELEKLLA